MSKTFLETTTLIEFIFWDKEAKLNIIKKIPNEEAKITSQYVIFELSRGYLRNLILLHNKSYELNKFSKLCAFASRVQFKPYYLGTILGAFENYFRTSASTKGLTDKEKLISFRAYLKRTIRRGWNDIYKQMNKIINDVGCKNTIEAPYRKENELYDQNLYTDVCGVNRSCGLKRYIATHCKDFVKMKDYLEKIRNPDTETTNRVRSLRNLYRKPKHDFEKKDCYYSGDAIITHETPAASTLLSKNKKHIQPLCAVLDKKAEFYS